MFFFLERKTVLFAYATYLIVLFSNNTVTHLVPQHHLSVDAKHDTGSFDKMNVAPWSYHQIFLLFDRVKGAPRAHARTSARHPLSFSRT